MSTPDASGVTKYYRYTINTLKIRMKWYNAVRFDFDSIRFNTMRFDAIRCNGKNMITFISLVQTDSKSWINLCVFWLLTPRGLFHKTSLPNRPGLFQLDWLTVKWFGSHKANLTKINLSHCGYLCWKANLVQGRQTVRLSWAPLILTNILPLSHTIIAMKPFSLVL